MTWTGSDKQIAWAKSIKAEAEPVIAEWLAQLRRDHTRVRADYHISARSKARELTSIESTIRLVNAGRDVEDARFWIDLRNCSDVWAFINATRTWQSRGAR